MTFLPAEPLPEGGRRDWKQAGADMTDTPEKRTRVLEAANQLAWFPLEDRLRLPAMPGLAIEALIRDFRLAGVKHMGHGHGLAPYSIVGIEAQMGNGLIRFYAVDRGTRISPLFVDFYPTGTTAPPLPRRHG